jgi:valyl-tRNA synthetase
MIKPEYLKPIDFETHKATIAFFENILKILHPFMPFITEELWHYELFGSRSAMDCCIVAQLPSIGKLNTQVLADIEMVKQVVTQIRNIRENKQISPKEKLDISVKENGGVVYKKYSPIISKLGNISIFSNVKDKVVGAVSFMVSTDEFYIPLEERIDPVAECARLRKDKEYLTGFLRSVNSKLSNEKFMSNAKAEIIEVELKKKADAEAKLKITEENLLVLACELH